MRTFSRVVLAGGAAAALVVTSGAVVAGASAATGGGAPIVLRAAPEHRLPKIFGTTFQQDPGHDFTKRIRSRHDGVLRGWVTHVSGGVAEYEPIRWKKGTHTEGRFVGPPEGEVMAYASRLSSRLVYLSALGCGRVGTSLTVDRRGLGVKRCPRSLVAKRLQRPAMITVREGAIVRIQEIYTP
ncbi:hypothetical protein [Nonomuraea indica]|uniref:hypothetical protein n=1 Tax=Nonomuraea indica TaxID=1581193 RepID=UPI000C7A77CA|nr:hypothetical protein [Nonomuraea indica]